VTDSMGEVLDKTQSLQDIIQSTWEESLSEKVGAGREDSNQLIEWLWVGGYSCMCTLVVVFNSVLFFSVAKNSYLQYSTHYTVLALAIRNILQMLVSICILLMTKLQETPNIMKEALLHTQKETNLICEILSCLDTFLSSLLMFYLLGLAAYMFCRSPNPRLAAMSETSLKMYGLRKQVVPIRENGWQAPLILLLPPLCALLLALPAPLLHLPHSLSAIHDIQVCVFPVNLTYQTSVATLASALPILTLTLLLIGLSIRRCLTCNGGDCISSFCKEEIFLAMISVPYCLSSFGKHIPLLDMHLDRLGMAPTGLQEIFSPAIVRGMESSFGLLLPALLYCLLPLYRKFGSRPDSNDLYQSKRDIYRNSTTSTGGDHESSDSDSEESESDV